MVLNKLKRHFVIEGRISQLLIFFSDARDEKEVL